MSSKETKQKLKQAAGVSMEELVRRGEMDEFAHLEELSDVKEDLKKFSSWVKEHDGKE